MIFHICCFQVFQLTALVSSSPSESHPIFTASLDGVTFYHEEAKRAVARVQDFGRQPLFTQRNFFSEIGIGMLSTAVAAADAVRNSSEFGLWRAVGVAAGPLIADLESCCEKVVLRRKTVKDTRRCWVGASSAVGEATTRTTVRISDVVGVGDVQYIEVPLLELICVKSRKN